MCHLPFQHQPNTNQTPEARSGFMMTSSNGTIFRVTGHLLGEFTGHWWIPRTKASDVELWCFLDLRVNIRLSKQLRGWWFETLLPPLWRHCNVNFTVAYWRHMATGSCANLGLDNCLLPDSSKMFRMIITNLRLETKHLELQWYNPRDNDFTQ